MKKFKVSVIIPVYNAGKYLRDCLDSVISQTLRDIEIICVNDGSTDDSLVILEEYIQKDSRISVINQINKGVSVARNNAIEIARGEYIAFLDSDDRYAVLNALEDAYTKISQEKKDILVFAGENFIENKFHSKINTDLIMKCIQGTNTLDDFINLNIVVWDKLFCTEFIKNNKILFPERLTLGEDSIFCYLAYFSGAKYCYLNKCLINHNFCIVNSATSKCAEGIKAVLNSLKYLFNFGIFQAQDRNIQLLIINIFCGSAVNYWTNLEDETCRDNMYVDMLKLEYFLEMHYDCKELRTQILYRRLIKRIKQYKGVFPYNILSRTKFKNYMQIRLCGFEKKIPLKIR